MPEKYARASSLLAALMMPMRSGQAFPPEVGAVLRRLP